MMRTIRLWYIISIFISLHLSPSNISSQEKFDHSAYHFDDLSAITPAQTEKIPEGAKFTWKGADGEEYGMKRERGNLSSWIKYGDEWVQHGRSFFYGKSYGSPSIKYLQKVETYEYGDKHGESVTYALDEGNTPFIQKEENYWHGLRNGTYVEYQDHERINRIGQHVYGKRTGKWWEYFTTGSIMYEYDYNKTKGTRKEYEIVMNPADQMEKGRLKRLTEYGYLIKDEKGKWVKHGKSTYYDPDGEETVTFYKEGKPLEEHLEFVGEIEPPPNSCVKDAAEFSALLKKVKSTGPYAKVVKREGGLYCAYLVKVEQENLPFSTSTIRKAQRYILDLQKSQRTCTASDCSKLRVYRRAVDGIRG